MKDIIGRKVKLLPQCMFYFSDCPDNNVMTVVSVSDHGGCGWINVTDSAGCSYPCFPSELRYLNNKPVKLEQV